jgi:hypothetical protein
VNLPRFSTTGFPLAKSQNRSCLCALLTLPLVAGGCADQIFTPTPQLSQNRTDQNNTQPRKNTPADAAAERWAQELGKWVRGEIPKASLAGASKQKPLVFVDVVALAQRHPAWRLASALESGTTGNGGSAGTADLVSLNFAVDTSVAPFPTIAGNTTAGTSRAPADDTAPGAVSYARAGRNGSRSGYQAGMTSAAATRIVASGLANRQDIARRQQEAAVDRFLEDATERQKDERIDRAASLRAALRDEVAASTRNTLEELEPVLPADPIQLEMTNLRLRLLTNSDLTEAEVEAARAELRELEARWQAQLKAQEEARIAELNRLRVERPLQLRREGEARLAAVLAEAEVVDARLRQEIHTAHASRVAADFDAITRTLGIELPGTTTTIISPRGDGGASPQETSENLISIETFLPDLSSMPHAHRSNASASKAAMTPRSTAYRAANSRRGTLRLDAQTRIQARLLRLRALGEAQRWAQTAARRGDWTLVSTLTPQKPISNKPVAKKKILDGTRTALRLLGMR